MLTILVTDRNLNVVGPPIVDEIVTLTSILRHNGVSAGTWTGPALPALVDLVDPDPDGPGYSGDRRIVLIRDGQVWDSGPIIEVSTSRAVSGDDSGVGRLTVSWAGDMLWIAGRLVYPNPAQAADAQTAERWLNTGLDNAELAMRALVNSNAGPGALEPRRVPQLALGDLAAVGGNIKVSARFSPLADELRAAALAGGGLGFRTRQTTGKQILFEVFAPRDLTGRARFSFGLGNLRSVVYRRVMPTVTAVAVGGQGEGENRTISEHLNAAGVASWGRVETWADRRDTDDSDTLDQAGEETLAEGAEQAQLSTVTVDTPRLMFGRDYGLGDRVSVQPRDGGRDVADVVQAAQLEFDASTGDEQVTATVGTQEASTDPKWVRLLRRIDRQVKFLQTNAE